LPDHLSMIRLRALDDGRWQAHCEFDAGNARDYVFASDAEAERRVADTLAADLGFNEWCAGETARRLFEPFLLAADWAW
jgi:hypothetical protein